MQIVDTNIVLRYILDDHVPLSEQAKRIVDDNIVEVPIEVLCEVVYVLTSVYKVSRFEISAEMKGFFDKTQCEIPHRNAVFKGLDIFANNNIDIVDCILVGYCECENAEVHTFDKKLKKLLVRQAKSE